jgi:hypothetical protein
MQGIGRGTFEREVNGKKYGFRFGNYASSITEEKTGQKITETLSSMIKVNDAGVLETTQHTLKALNLYFYGGAVWYAELNNKPVPTPAHVAVWMEEIGDDEVVKIWQESLVIPNAETPEKETSPGK